MDSLGMFWMKRRQTEKHEHLKIIKLKKTPHNRDFVKLTFRDKAYIQFAL